MQIRKEHCHDRYRLIHRCCNLVFCESFLAEGRVLPYRLDFLKQDCKTHPDHRRPGVTDHLDNSGSCNGKPCSGHRMHLSADCGYEDCLPLTIQLKVGLACSRKQPAFFYYKIILLIYLFIII